MSSNTTDFSIPLICALIGVAGGLTGSIIGVIGVSLISKKERKSKLNSQIEQLILISIEYPYLENDGFCSFWDPEKAKTDEKYMRYENYCCLVFNLLQDIFEYFKGNRIKIDDYFGAEEMFTRHKPWWGNPGNNSENIKGYSEKFRKYLESYE